MDFLKQFDIETLEKFASQIASVEEFPSKADPPSSTNHASVDASSTIFNRTKQALEAWGGLNMEAKRREWEDTCIRLKQYQANSSDGGDWEERAKESEFKLQRIYQQLLAVPDPVPMLSSLSSLSSRIIELETVNRQLATEASSVSADVQEVQALIQNHRELQIDHKALKDHLEKIVDDLAGARELEEAGKRAMAELGAQGNEMARLRP